MVETFDLSQFTGMFDLKGIFSQILTIAMIVFVAVIIIGIMYFIYKKKGKGQAMKKIGWWEEVNQAMIPLNVDDAEEITIPGTNLKVFYIKHKDLWLPRFTRGITKDLFYVAITADKEIVNFTLKSLSEDRREAGLHYDHTDMRWAAENTREFIKRNYRDKSTKWWKEYKDIISVAILIFVMTFCFVIIIFFMRGIVDDISAVANSIGAAADKLNACSTGSGIVSA